LFIAQNGPIFEKNPPMSFLTAANERVIKLSAYFTTFAICAVVVILNQKWIPHPESFPDFIYGLPLLNAILNGSCALLLIFSLIAIKQRNIALHKKLNLSAFFLSALFLISYVTAHYFIPDTKYGDADHNGIMSASESLAVSGIKPLYLIILLSHILLAVIVLPMVLLSFYYGLSDQREKHKKLTRYSYPVWLYVTISGVVVYLMISPYYNF
jgi:putative membrane protein